MALTFLMIFIFIFYTYLGYPIFLSIWSYCFHKRVNKKYTTPDPFVSVIIAARNEENNIENRISNILAQNYPKDKINIIIVSDGSTDNTNAIVNRLIREIDSPNSFGKKKVRLSVFGYK